MKETVMYDPGFEEMPAFTNDPNENTPLPSMEFVEIPRERTFWSKRIYE